MTEVIKIRLEEQQTDGQTVLINSVKKCLVQTLGGVGSYDKTKLKYGLSGSCNLVQIQREDGDYNILVDFGMHQGPGSNEMNQELPIDPSKIDLFVGTHGHIDHVGRVPMLLKGEKEFKGKIVMHKTTLQIAKIMLLDCAKLMLDNYAKQVEKSQRDKILLLEKFKIYQKLLDKKEKTSSATNQFEYTNDANQIFFQEVGERIKKPSQKFPSKKKAKTRKKSYKKHNIDMSPNELAIDSKITISGKEIIIKTIYEINGDYTVQIGDINVTIEKDKVDDVKIISGGELCDKIQIKIINEGKNVELKISGEKNKEIQEYKLKKKQAIEHVNYQEDLENTQNLVEIGLNEETLDLTKLYEHLSNIVEYLGKEKDGINEIIKNIETKINSINLKKTKAKKINKLIKVIEKLEDKMNNYFVIYTDIIALQDYFIEKKGEYSGIAIKDLFEWIEGITQEIINIKNESNFLDEIDEQLENIIDLFKILKYDFCHIDILNDEIEKLEIDLKRENILSAGDIKILTRGKKLPARKKILYYAEDVMKILGPDYVLNRSLDYHQEIEVFPGISLKLLDAAHVIGSSQVQITINNKDKKDIRLGFSGDVGKFNNNTLNTSPEISNDMYDFYMLESTYGDKIHTDRNAELKRLVDITNEIYHNRGKILIPAFMLQRLQDVALCLFKLQDEGIDGKYIFENMPIYGNGKNVPFINQLFQAYTQNQDYKLLGKNGRLKVSQKKTKGKNIDEFRLMQNKSGIMLTPSGMITGGPVMQYLTLLTDPKNAIFFVGYQAEGSLGRKIQEGASQIYVIGKGEIKINARVETFKSFSNHADQNDLLRIAEGLRMTKNGIIAINHGDKAGGQEGLARQLKSRKKVRHDVNILTPHLDDEIVIYEE